MKPMVHPIDRLMRSSPAPVSVCLHAMSHWGTGDDHGFSYRMKRARWDTFVKNPVCPIVRCDLCGRFGGRRRIRDREDVYRWDIPPLDPEGWQQKSVGYTLCTPCWRGVRPLARLGFMVQHIGRLARKLEREATRAKQGRKDAGHAAAGHRGCEGRQAGPGQSQVDGGAGAPSERVAGCRTASADRSQVDAASSGPGGSGANHSHDRIWRGRAGGRHHSAHDGRVIGGAA